MSTITLHHKHGVAPALMFCRICGRTPTVWPSSGHRLIRQ